MKVLMFQSKFAPKVLAGSKTQTIRSPRKRPVKAGDRLSLRMWTGLPYRSPQRILREAICTRVQGIVVSETGIWIEGDRLATQPHVFARADGFADWPDMRDWFSATHGLPFDGVVISWSDQDPCARQKSPASKKRVNGRERLKLTDAP